MANQGALSSLGNVVRAHKGFRAEVNTRYHEERFKITGPSRDNDQQAHDDLRCIRASAEAASSRLDGLGAMRTAAYELRNRPREFQGGIEEGLAHSYRARIQCKADAISTMAIRGPTRGSQRRAEADLARLRAASQGHDTGQQQLRAVQAEVERLSIQAQRFRAAPALAQSTFK